MYIVIHAPFKRRYIRSIVYIVVKIEDKGISRNMWEYLGILRIRVYLGIWVYLLDI
jgi:hypothetical protein